MNRFTDRLASYDRAFREGMTMAIMQRHYDQRIVVTGLGILCALGSQPEAVFKHMLTAKTGIRALSRFPADKLHCSIAGELEPAHLAAIEADGSTASMDLCARFAVAAARQALQHSGLMIQSDDDSRAEGTLSSIGASRIGLTLGTCNGGILSLEKQWTVTALDADNTANYPFYQQGDDAARAIGVRGPVATMNTACAASGNAIGYASDMIRWGYADVMLAGGSDPLSHSVYAGFNVLRALNPLPTSPFGDRYGLNLGEGAAFVVLERMDKALQRGARIYGELCAYGLSNDAYHETAPHPDGAGIHRATAMALHQGQVPVDRIHYINAHGTGTLANDRAEIKGLKQVFGDEMAVPLSSSKAYFGHNLGAAAAVELVTSLYAIDQGRLPATLHYDAPREGCDDINLIAGEMPHARLTPEYMLSNNAAFGGHNVSLLLRMSSETAAPNNGGSFNKRARVAITGLGAAGCWGLHRPGLLDFIASRSSTESNDRQEWTSFALKEYDKSKYERRMNQITQSTIGAAMQALQDAGIPAEIPNDTGFIYGTARGSTESIERYLGSVFEKGPEYASSIFFPHTVINSVAGKTAEKLQFTGFNSSFSTGGNEGITAALYAAGKIGEGALTACLIGAGDERSALSDHIDCAKGLHASRYPMTEGSVCMMLADMDQSLANHARIYGELCGFGIAFGAVPHTREGQKTIQAAVAGALDEARIAMQEVDLVLLNSIGRPEETEWERDAVSQAAGTAVPPIVCLNETFGYGESISSMLHLAVAAELVFAGGSKGALGLLEQRKVSSVLTISSSVNGNYTAAIIKAVEA
ncbi:3-oxoacyl-ACP synthase [Paenibacillaceae bacterium]|nr:3-oxoacyl-ACP synthase [Paenibacillaceae bacterium]